MQKRKPRIVLAIDFDETIAKTVYPIIIRPRFGAIRTVNKLYDEGYGIIINTCREGLALADAITWMDSNNLKRDYVNCNFPHRIEHFKSDCRKISADCYIDDKNILQLNNPIDWDNIYEILTNEFKYLID